MNINLKLPRPPSPFHGISEAESYSAQLCRYLERLVISLGRILTNIDDDNVTEISASKVSGITTESVSGLDEYAGALADELKEYADALTDALRTELKEYVDNKIK